MNNPFDWKNYQPTISMADVERARKSAYQQTRVVNDKRKQGVEPSKPYAQRNKAHLAGVPQEYTLDMPVMPMHKRSIKRSQKK